ncbi:uncharacterized protein LOC124613848 [Schistocerca americana]|uniref:uncharacterized protein LOC124613848 n=1 Tax=Schistocerca americana TaxID=7009 RepID=UPI001F4FE8C5|nr:uncharacterized protein LOC124613848 [Schistocerca americana]
MGAGDADDEVVGDEKGEVSHLRGGSRGGIGGVCEDRGRIRSCCGCGGWEKGVDVGIHSRGGSGEVVEWEVKDEACANSCVNDVALQANKKDKRISSHHNPRGPICYNCSKYGHIAKNCGSKKKEGKNQ